MEKKIIYFENAGKVNTEETLKLAKERALELGVKDVILASSHGFTAKTAIEVFKDIDLQIIVVGSNRESFSMELLKTLEKEGVMVKFSDDVSYNYPELMRNAFKKLSEGVKVCMDICMVAAEAGLVSDDREVVAIAGTSSRGFENGGGADTALVMIPRKSEDFNRLPEKAKRRDVKEIICKPR